MPRNYKRLFSTEAVIVTMICALIVGFAFGSMVYVATDILWLAFVLGTFMTYAVIDVFMRSPKE